MPASWIALWIALVFILPGYVMESTVRTFQPRPRRTGNEQLLHCLVYSSLNLAFWWVVLPSSSWSTERPPGTRLLILMVFCSPILFGFIRIYSSLYWKAALGWAIGWAKSKIIHWEQVRWVADSLGRSKRVQWVLDRLILQPFHPVPTSWDFVFSKGLPASVIVTLKDGRSVFGYWGENSFASTEPTERDIFIEKVFQAPEDGGPCRERPRSKGMLILAEEIRHIEFMSEDEGEKCDGE